LNPLTPSDGFTTSICGAVASSETGARSRSGSNGMLRYSALLMANTPLVLTSSVWPSGAALATASAPMLPPAPARFSTTNGWPIASCRRLASARPTMSGVEPGGKVTTTLTGLEG
jgi:hypothetical protein